MEATPTTERIFLNIEREGEVLGRTEAGRMRVEERVTKDAQEQTGQGQIDGWRLQGHSAQTSVYFS